MIIPALLLSILGTIVISSSSTNLAIGQAIYIGVGLLLYIGLSKLDYQLWKPFFKPVYIVIIALLLFVLFLGYETRGSVRWIPLGLFNFQPSEFAKIILILVLANFWSKKMPDWKNISKSILMLFPIAFLVFRQPDLGTALTIVFIWITVLLAANLSFKKIFLIFLIGMMIIPSSWFFLKDYQKHRITTFLYPEHDPLGLGYNVIQSTIAVGSGQIYGRGLGRGTQSRLQFLPEYRTDFIFASIAEELGMIGSLVVLFLYSTLFFTIYRILSQVRDRFGELIVVGVMGMLFFQMVVNIGMNIGIMPVTGITLPLLSYGGSSILTIFICLGLLASIKRYSSKNREFTSLDNFLV